ncbi:hypothetical protein QLS71_016455 [Mariniflexile litorale]|uniref:Uncharacterized protein n=1 Tax=Mariniflexile litorale TaxID=3045158 RepID=A0AAU7EFG2_9FLAO|nr:hypothetical protein [Mariniflexile sp. KMM 9835]MDQ8211434.1 hypothetical protein [Mariniflexile sp. KMM 9835]
MSTCIISCAPLKSVKISENQYTEIIETINQGLSLSKDKIDKSSYKLKSGSIKIYIANNITGEAGIAFWVIEGGYKTVNEKASSITYNFSEISKPMSGDQKSYQFQPKDLKELINRSIDNYDQAGDIMTLKKNGFDINIKFSISNSGSGKVNLDFGIGANVKGSFSKTASHEITLSFVPK